MLSAPPDEDGSTRNSSNPVNKLVHGIVSYNTNIMLAAIISLLMVILFVLLLQVYAKWFLVQTRTSSRSSVSVPQVLLGGTTLHHFHSTASDSTTSATSLTKGLDSLVISSIPQFAYKSDEHGLIDQCAICLSVFEDEEMGRRLPRCSHAFHVDCIDMWLDSHSTCPICRCPVLLFHDKILEFNPSPSDEVVDQDISEIIYSETQLNDVETSRLEITVDDIPNAENENSGSTVDTLLSSSSHVRLPVTVSDSVKRMMSRNRSERKVHPSASDVESNVS